MKACRMQEERSWLPRAIKRRRVWDGSGHEARIKGLPEDGCLPEDGSREATRYRCMDAPCTAHVVDCCERNNVAGLSTLLFGASLLRPDIRTILISERGTYPFRLLARLLLRAISSRHFEIADILVRHLAPLCTASSDRLVDPDAVDDLLRRLARVLLALFTDPKLNTHLPSWLHALQHIGAEEGRERRWSVERWKDFEELYRNEGGECGVWSRFRASSRAMLASRLFAQDKSWIHETYVPYFSASAFGKRPLQILASQCRMFVSKSQLCKSLFANNSFLQTDILTAVLETWREITKPSLREMLRINSDDLQILLYITNPDIRRERFDAVTTAGPKITILAQDLQRFHLTAFVDEQNPVPWIHATILISRPKQHLSCTGTNNQIVAFYLSKQISIRNQTKSRALSIIDQASHYSLPPELLRLVLQYVFSDVRQLVSIDPDSIPPDEQLAFTRLWTNPPKPN